ncbi:hypothetical protein M2157_000199 [Streptomyces sp. SAI-127]|nr:hypothetical protein [Streptomyces sp. SAI-127]
MSVTSRCRPHSCAAPPTHPARRRAAARRLPRRVEVPQRRLLLGGFGLCRRPGDILEYLEDPALGTPALAEGAARTNVPLATNMCMTTFAEIKEAFTRCRPGGALRPPLLGRAAQHPATRRHLPHLRRRAVHALQHPPGNLAGRHDPRRVHRPGPAPRLRLPLPLAVRGHTHRAADLRGPVREGLGRARAWVSNSTARNSPSSTGACWTTTVRCASRTTRRRCGSPSRDGRRPPCRAGNTRRKLRPRRPPSAASVGPTVVTKNVQVGRKAPSAVCPVTGPSPNAVVPRPRSCSPPARCRSAG